MALNGKVAVVTGAAMGIGKAITEMLLQNGAKVALLDVNETAGKDFMEALEKQYGQERTLFMICNVESEEQLKAAFQKTAETFGGIDILCNNAGILNESAWEKTVSINLMGTIRGTYLALEHMSKLSGGRGGVIVNTASLAAKLGQYCQLVDATQQLVEKIGISTVDEVAESLLELLTDETKNGEALLVFQQKRQYATFPSLI
ncbi:15-hydroxyprostaglandin dehydrogenase [NAD(+)]-like isoform X2 [Chaetodon trifascialis]|uniref:15-hydroxyprostaglandin dehydrogenase [NAD(+)]-like isoform X2 n=1 Tax=Chaetodon trifascialis TaxID=109706 RepID=UPI0039920231